MKKKNLLETIAERLRVHAISCEKAGIKETAEVLRYYSGKIDEIGKAFEPLVEFDFGDYKTPWQSLRIASNNIEGAAMTADGFPFSLSSSSEFGFDAMIEMANIIGGVQSAMKAKEKVYEV